MVTPSLEIHRFKIVDAEAYRAIRLAALKTAPEAFGSAYKTEAAWPVADFVDRLATSAVFGAYAAGGIVGVAGFKQESGPKGAHKGFVWGVYVQPDARRHGVGAALIEAILQSASEVVEQLTLAVAQGNNAAIEMYRKFGFEVYGVEPRALKTCTGYSDEVLMVRFLRPPSQAAGANNVQFTRSAQ